MTNRELDAKVATEVMGWTAERKPGLPHLWLPPEHFISGWQPSRDIAAAMQVAEKMKGFISIERHNAPLGSATGVTWKVLFPGKTLNFVTASADTLPEAICKAAVMAAEAE